jgi:pimeloyl-ACP methyl ester carboxylesterase
MTAFRWIEGAGGEIVADGKRLEAVAYGPRPDQTPTLVMLHEGLGCVALWRDFPARLAAATGWGVFTYSRAGYGRYVRAGRRARTRSRRARRAG